MGGGLMQLVAYGAQDIYLTGNPQITFFKVVYRRHTNFSMEAIEQTLNGTVEYGNRVSATISRNGDLVGRMYYEVDINGLAEGDKIIANLGSGLIKEVECEVGGQRIDKHYGHWMEVWSELTEPNSAAHSGSVPAAVTKIVNGTKFQNMSYMGGVAGNTVNSSNGDGAIKAFIPLQFWFCRNPGLALPLIALQYHEVKVVTEFNKEVMVIQANTNAGHPNATGAGTNLAVKLYADYIYLDTDERRRFAQVSHEYLIEQLQFEEKSSSKSHELNFNHPVKELIWTGGVSGLDGLSANVGTSTPLSVGDGVNYHLKLNGHDRFSERDYHYFTRAQVWQHHTGAGGITPDGTGGANDAIAVYSFALKPEEHQPSGTCNFSRIDNAQLVCQAEQAVYVYAVNYNVLRIMSGMGGLAYSN